MRALRDLEILDLADDLRLDEGGALHLRELGVVARRRRTPQRLEELQHPAERRPREPRAHLPDPEQLAVVVGADKQRAERPAPPALPWGPPEDHAAWVFVVRVRGRYPDQSPATILAIIVGCL